MITNYAGSPEFCAIAPIAYSQLVAGRKAHLVLAHLIDRDHAALDIHRDYVDVYTAFIQAEAAAGAFIMMDNSAYELKKPYEPEKLLELAQLCGAHAIVLPDYPFNHSSKTIEAAKQFAPIFKEAGFKTFFVPQSQKGDQADWIAAYNWAANGEGKDLVDIIGVSILGVPVAFPELDPAFARVVVMKLLKEQGIFNPEKHHHYLGLNAGPALEIPSLLRMGVLSTVDSSGPVWAGINTHRYSEECDSYQAVKKLTSAVDFFMPYTKDKRIVERITHNVQLTDELFKPDVYARSAPWYAEE